MMRLSSFSSHVMVVIFGLIIASIVSYVISGDGYFSFLFLDINRNALAGVVFIPVCGLYIRKCYTPPIPPNQQGIQLFLGAQTGEVMKESNFVFLPWPLWSVWKTVSIEHFSFTVAAQNRTKEGHSMIVFATGKAIPENVQLLAKMSQEGIQEQVVGLSMMAVGAYINNNIRNILLSYQSWEISEYIEDVFGKNEFYGLRVKVFTTKVIEVNPETMKQFDLYARQTDMGTTLGVLKQSFPGMSDVELYAVYATLVGITPATMSYVVHGGGTNNILLGRGGNHNDLN